VARGDGEFGGVDEREGIGRMGFTFFLTALYSVGGWLNMMQIGSEFNIKMETLQYNPICYY